LNLVLIGYRGCGKSTVGPLLARRLGWEFVDVDDIIVERAGRSIREIFVAESEDGFRRREREVCESLRKRRHHVIALGGGALTHPDVRMVARRLGKIIWLRAPAAVLWSRISKDPKSAAQRPDLTPQGGLPEVEELLRRREREYEAAAAHTVDTMSDDPDQVAEAIEIWFHANDIESGSA
jgi:shikimate kinase